MEISKSVCLCVILFQLTNVHILSESSKKIPLERPLKLRDVNDNHKPHFKECANYKPEVKEEKIKEPVIQVKAEDNDPIENGGNITYKIIQKEGERKYFSIDYSTGWIETAYAFDRDEPTRLKEVYISVQATDNGRPSLADICTFKVIVLDINDNSPTFDQAIYNAPVSEDLKPGSEVMRVLAYDVDDGENSKLTYSFKNGDPKFSEFFRINNATGVIHLKQSLASKIGTKFEESVRVNDNGEPIRENSAAVSVIVVSSEKQSPNITSDHYSITLKESYADFGIDIPLFIITADSKIEDKSVVLELMKGKTTQTNKDQTFLLHQRDTQGLITLARPLDYETVVEYTLTISVSNKDKLRASLTVKILIEDVNDEVPNFIELLTGSVLENDEEGAVAMQVRAIDKDGTPANNVVRYELMSHTESFKIDQDSGTITAVQSFDREKDSVYHVQVKAYDNSPSALLKTHQPNSVTQTFQISIEDKNDNAPVFVHKEYFVEAISETADVSTIVIEVQAVDKDTASLINYTIIDGNTEDAFYIESSTGRIKIKNKLDYEKIENYTLTVQANDGIYNDTAQVYIKVGNENDEVPEFEKFEKEVHVIEEQVSTGCEIILKAYDRDIKDRSADQKIKYGTEDDFIDISQDGCLKVIKPLDRDGPEGAKKQAFVSATDSVGPSFHQTFVELTLILEDINDNAPFLNVTEVVWQENQGSGRIMVLSADDIDSEKNGPPFKFTLSNGFDEFSSKFEVVGNELVAKVKFDREIQKYYDVPIEISDNGTPVMTAISILRVIIGDENDNPAAPGESSITVYKYVKLSEDINIGRVYVNDPDDWDLGDKKFQLTPHDNFYLNKTDQGMIVMRKDTENGTYYLDCVVIEEAPLIPQHSVDAKVKIVVKIIPEEAVIKSGSIRLNGTTIEEMIEVESRRENSRMDQLQKYLSTWFNTSLENVDVFQLSRTNNSFIDLRFSAHGSPYYLPEKLNNKVADNQQLLEKDLGINMYMIGINECLNETRCPSSCSNVLSIKEEPAVVFTNKTSFVGIKAVVEAECSCIPKTPNKCEGVIIEDGVCSCPPGSSGPNCEILAIGFSGNSWALYPTFDACEKGTITLSIAPQSPDGLIFYSGPVTMKQAELSKDFISLELRDYTLVLKLDFGYGSLEMVAKTEDKLDDGASHFVNITYDTESVQLTVGYCKSNCLKWESLPLMKGLLNINGPLQMGKLKKTFSDQDFANKYNLPAPSSKGFTGCVQNLTFNDFLYNLGTPSDDEQVHVNCNYGFAAAVTFGIDSNFLVAILVCLAILIILLLAVVVHKRKHDNFNEKDIDDTRETIINYEDEGGGECDAMNFDLSVFHPKLEEELPVEDSFHQPQVPAALTAFLDTKKDTCDRDPDNFPYDDVRHYAYQGDGNSSGSLSTLASCTDEGDLKFNYLSNFGPRFRKLADMYGNDNSDDDSQEGAEESWC